MEPLNRTNRRELPGTTSGAAPGSASDRSARPLTPLRCASFPFYNTSTDTIPSSASDTLIKIANAVGNGTAEGCSVTLNLADPLNAAVQARTLAQSTIYYQDDNVGSIYSSGRRLAAQKVDAIQLFFTSGNIASGTYAVYAVY